MGIVVTLHYYAMLRVSVCLSVRLSVLHFGSIQPLAGHVTGTGNRNGPKPAV